MNYSAIQDCTLEEIICAWFSTQNDMSRGHETLDNSIRRGKVFRWEPARDDIWIFKTGYIDQIKIEKFTSSFVEKFLESLETQDYTIGSSDLRIFPIALIDSKGEVKYPASSALASLEKICQKERKEEGIKEMNQEDQASYKKKLQKISLDLDNQAKIIIESSPTKLKNVIIFDTSMMCYSTIVEIEEFLTELNYCPSYVRLLKSSSHYQLNDPKSETPQVILNVTLFVYDCDEG